MKRFLVALLCMIAIAACKRDEKVPVLQCGGYDVQMEISADGDTMRTNINGDDLELSLVPSASGAKYAGILNDTTVVLWEKSGVWTMMLDEEQIIDCAAK